MGVFSSKQWNEMLEVQEMEEEEKAKTEKKRSPAPDKRTKVLRADPRSPTEEVNRTPIAVERQNDLDTPVLLSYSPLLPKLKTLAVDPRSPSGPDGLDRTPIVVEERNSRGSEKDLRRGSEKDMLRRVLNDSLSTSTPIRSSLASSSNSMDSPLTTSTPVMSPITKDEGAKKCDRGQPRKLLQNQFRGNLEALYDKDVASRESGAELGNESQDLVFDDSPSLGDLNIGTGTPPAAGDLVKSSKKDSVDDGGHLVTQDFINGSPCQGDFEAGTPPAAGDFSCDAGLLVASAPNMEAI